jgi:hypothetical protein
MKIDEPKTPFVSEEEFKKLCEADPDYQKEFGGDKNKEMEVNSQEADDNSDKQMEDDFTLANKNMQLNMNINLG